MFQFLLTALTASVLPGEYAAESPAQDVPCVAHSSPPLLGAWVWTEDDCRTTLGVTPHRLRWTITPQANNNLTVVEAEYTRGKDHDVSGTITRIKHTSESGYNFDLAVEMPFHSQFLVEKNVLIITTFKAEGGFCEEVVRGQYRKSKGD